MTTISRQTQGNTQELTQGQIFTPQQVLQVKILEMSHIELEDKVKQEMADNPGLEKADSEEADYDVRTAEADDNGNGIFGDDDNEGEGNNDEYEGDDPHIEEEKYVEKIEEEDRKDALADVLDSIDSDDYMGNDYKVRTNNSSSSAEQEEMVYGDTASFYDKLMKQVGEENLSETQRTIMEYLIGMLDGNGYLREELHTISDNLAIYHGVDVSVKEIEEVLLMLQEFDPIGIGARNLQECLLLQIDHRKDSRLTRNMRKVILKYFDEFKMKHWEKIGRHLRISEYETEEVINELRRLNPRPGASLGETMGKSIHQVTPDFIVDSSEDGGVTFCLNNGDIPRLNVTRDYIEQIRGYESNPKSLSKSDKQALSYYKEKVNSAKIFIDAIEKRQRTMYVTMKAIIEKQRRYFEDGYEGDLVPMTETEIAKSIGMDVSTVSRVCRLKYAQTPWGIFPLKHFFSTGVSLPGGDEQTNRKIKMAIKEIIDSEDKKKPLSDSAIEKELKKRDLSIARRTVAKYREDLKIPIARMRK